MISYQYQILRYFHDQFTGEFVNIGLVLYFNNYKILISDFTNKYSRISQFFNEINGNYLLSTLKDLKNQFKSILLDENIKFQTVEEITSYILPKDNSSLSFSEVYSGVDILPIDIDLKEHFQNIFEDLFERLVNKYLQDKSEIKNDSYVWKNIYKNYFEKLGLSDKLDNHSVKTKRDEIVFEKAWKNGVWNCYQPISFTLKNSEYIKNKVYKWSGIIQELKTSDENISLCFLSSLPKNEHPELIELIKDNFKEKDFGNLKVNLIEENEAESFVNNLKNQMIKSGLF